MRLQFAVLCLLSVAVFADEPPSRPVARSCAWEKFSDAALGLEGWVQRCDFGWRRIDFLTVGHALAVRYSDRDAPEPLVEVIDLMPDESAEAAVRRTFAAHTGKELVARCVLQTVEPWEARSGVKRYTFVPDAAYRKELDRTANPDEVPEPPCGDWGEAPDGIQYFEVHESAPRVLFVRVGQDMPMFDAETLRILPKK